MQLVSPHTHAARQTVLKQRVHASVVFLVVLPTERTVQLDESDRLCFVRRLPRHVRPWVWAAVHPLSHADLIGSLKTVVVVEGDNRSTRRGAEYVCEIAKVVIDRRVHPQQITEFDPELINQLAHRRCTNGTALSSKMLFNVGQPLLDETSDVQLFRTLRRWKYPLNRSSIEFDLVQKLENAK